jgi:hypothetical protein
MVEIKEVGVKGVEEATPSTTKATDRIITFFVVKPSSLSLPGKV